MHAELRLLLVASLATMAGCDGCGDDPGTPAAATGPLVSRPLEAAAAANTGDALFRRLSSDELGFEFRNVLKPDHVKRYLENGSGVAVGDFDADGKPDLYLLSIDGPNKLLRQTGSLKFEDVTAKAGVDGGEAWGTGASFVDIDADGDLDLFVCNLKSPNAVYVNQGDGTFVDKAAELGLAHEDASNLPAFADYDRDGDLDLYLLTNRVFSVPEEVGTEGKLRVHDGKAVVPPEFQDQYMIVGGRATQAGRADLLYRNDDGKFTEVSAEAGIAGFDMGLSATWLDFDDDGWLDLYVANDLKTPDHLYRNDGDGKFTDVIGKMVSHTPWASMGADAADINNDGFEDLFVADMAPTTHFKEKATMGDMGKDGWFLEWGMPRQFMRNALYMNTGTSRFLEASYLAGISRTDWTWSVLFGDLDNDGLIDLHVTNGAARMVNDSDINIKIRALQKEGKNDEATKLARSMPPQREANLAFKNLGNLSFQDTSVAWGLNDISISHGAALADLDRDGDLDIVVNNLNEAVSVYQNQSTGGARTLIELRGKGANRFGIGAKVQVKAGGAQQMRRLIPTRGYLSSTEPVLHFGLGDAKEIDELTVTWPSGAEQRFTALGVNQIHTITEPETPPAKPELPAKPDEAIASGLFESKAADLGLVFHHKELTFDDYEREPLLPYKLSQPGPGIAWGDVNGDGYDDLFVGGSHKQPGGIALRRSEGGFAPVRGPWEQDYMAEDVAALFVDVDGDDDLDLYVASGSNQLEAGHEGYRDRLYLNDGKGSFEKSEDVLPDLRLSTGSVAAADYDRDGDLDLFVGARSIPGRYPETPKSYLLENDGGHFRDATDKAAPALTEIGLVSGATWTDVDGDGWIDLAIALDWGPVTIFKNADGKLTNHTEASGIASLTGWWRGVASGDVDGDGDLDLVATNLGLNTKYAASKEHPLKLYYKDFDDSGTLDLVEASFEDATEFPIRGRSCSSDAMPFLADKFGTFNEFAQASIETVYSAEALAEADVRSASHLATSLFLNDGKGRLEVRPLPKLAQISPSFGVALSDFDADGDLDVVLGQNFFVTQRETGLLDGGLSVLLRGNGRGEFESVWPKESGIVIPQAIKGVALIDYDDDGRADILMAANNYKLQALRNRATTGTPLSVKLRGPKGNPTAVGAKVTLHVGETRVAQMVSAGSGYMAQSSATLFFGLGSGSASAVEVAWPDGTKSEQRDGLGGKSVTVAHPSR